MEPIQEPSHGDRSQSRGLGFLLSFRGACLLALMVAVVESSWIAHEKTIALTPSRAEVWQLAFGYLILFTILLALLWMKRSWAHPGTPQAILTTAAALWVIPYHLGWSGVGVGLVVGGVVAAWGFRMLPRWARRFSGAWILLLILVWQRGWLSTDAGPTLPPAEGVHLPNVVVVVIDTLRADHLGCYGHHPEGYEVSPQMDALAARGTLFENALAQAPWTRPSTASLFSSLYPASHRIVTPYDPLGAEIPTIATMLSERGYRTAAFSANPQVSPSFGFHHGFQHFWSSTSDLAGHSAGGRLVRRWSQKLGFSEKPAQGHRGVADSTADDVNAAVAAWSNTADSDAPTFLYVHYLDPHDPYTAPQDLLGMTPGPAVDEHPLYASQELPPYPLEGSSLVDLDADSMRELQRRYDTEIRFVDDRLGAMLRDLEERGLYGEGDWLILTSDHGEEFHEHEQWQHGRSLFEEMVHVPLLVVGPDAPSGLRLPEPAGLIDVLPTIAAVTGGKPDFPIHGRNLFAPSDGNREEGVLTHRPREKHPIWGLRTATRKLIWVMDDARRVELAYDLQADPLEQSPLPEPADQAWMDLRRRLAVLVETSGDLGREDAQEIVLDEEMARKLGQLGYIDGESEDDAPDQTED